MRKLKKRYLMIRFLKTVKQKFKKFYKSEIKTFNRILGIT